MVLLLRGGRGRGEKGKWVKEREAKKRQREMGGDGVKPLIHISSYATAGWF